MSNKFSKDEIVKWILANTEMVIIEEKVKDKEGNNLLDGPWWICYVPGKLKLKAVIHENRLEKV